MFETEDAECPSCECGRPASERKRDRGIPESLRFEGHQKTPAGDVPCVAADLNFRDKLGALKVRWGIGRMSYRVSPGLYAVGNPDSRSPVLVSSNYKLSLDSLRRELVGRDAWILVLDTKGINVWCAAGKGTFGTEEIVRRVETARLAQVVSHRKLVLPQLGAPGVAAHEVQSRTGFHVVYGPVRAADLASFLDRGMKAAPEMRRVKFGFRERARLVPEEIVPAIPILLIIAAIQALLSLISSGRLSVLDFVPITGAILAGCVLVPLLLPWIPARAFALKGWLVGVLWTLAFQAYSVQVLGHAFRWSRLVMSLLLLPPISAYVAMNFTGSSTFTSLSGVVKEMRRAVPLMIASVSLYVLLFVLAFFVRF